MSVFVAGLAFDDVAYGVPVRVGVLSGSILAAVIGAVVLKVAGRQPA